MRMDPKNLVIIPQGDRRQHLVLPLKDVPGFRPTCSDPTKTVDINTAKDHRFAGYDDLAALPWTVEDPTTPHPERSKDTKVTKDPQTPASTPKKSKKTTNDDQNALIVDIYACVGTKSGTTAPPWKDFAFMTNILRRCYL
ncbi:uncharacterized protein N7496_012361 [Penicillium cataractarum]|uniref:Uncharacterized protein n=1 Tax=Penicillium cataractarum TaxID=2100454 RepID=A0A9W9USQ0_9EURO|nr:uncharacterized protein N7496_012361 [Penicillium cataractarum]KAJ5355149.1 hypothetical protein N7496_012361 [Penicillium cataractarum]